MEQKPMRVPVVYLRGKQFFKKENGVLRLVGKPTDMARELSGTFKLIHIIDLDSAGIGISPNFDVYDSLTQFVNIEVECTSRDFARKLVEIKGRAVIRLPCRFGLEEFSECERLMVGIAGKEYAGDASGVHDLILENADDKRIEELSKTKKRLIVHESDYEKLSQKNKKKIWAVLEQL